MSTGGVLEPYQQPSGLPVDLLMLTEGMVQIFLRSFAPQLSWENTQVSLNVGSPSSQLTGKTDPLSFLRLRQWLNNQTTCQGPQGW